MGKPRLEMQTPVRVPLKDRTHEFLRLMLAPCLSAPAVRYHPVGRRLVRSVRLVAPCLSAPAVRYHRWEFCLSSSSFILLEGEIEIRYIP